MTAHISADIKDIAEVVIMPGDPLRSKMIAENFLENPVLVNDVRGVQGYTGTYNGKKVTVMASGMGNPSMGIYSYELFKFYNVNKIIRVGSIGAMHKDIKIKDVIIGKSVYTNTNYNNFYINNGEGYIPGSVSLCEQARKIAEKNNINYHIGNILCSDTFYTDEDEIKKSLDNNLLGVEMEGAAIAQVAFLNEIPFLIIRAISDKADDSATMDYGEFERKAIDNSVALLCEMLGRI